jgi:hypothetical protein
VCYFFPRPSAGSACKRLNLFLRWMVRSDEVDLGVWRGVPKSKLIVPLDTHVIRVGRCLRLTNYTSPGWRMARDITASLRRLDTLDPVKYDFSLCHVGMMNACGFAESREIRNARFEDCVAARRQARLTGILLMVAMAPALVAGYLAGRRAGAVQELPPARRTRQASRW